MEPSALHAVRHGEGRPVLVLHGAGVDHREPEACFEPILAPEGLRRVYPDLPGMGRSSVPDWVRSTDDVLHLMLDFAYAEFGDEPFLLIGHSWGAYLARAMAARRADQAPDTPCRTSSPSCSARSSATGWRGRGCRDEGRARGLRDMT